MTCYASTCSQPHSAQLQGTPADARLPMRLELVLLVSGQESDPVQSSYAVCQPCSMTKGRKQHYV